MSDELEAGQTVLGRYVIEKTLGQGAMGQVYLARHRMLDMPVAVKVLLDAQAPQLLDRFDREARLMARVRHPNIVGILDYGVIDQRLPCIVMEFVEGDELSALIDEGPIPWPRTLIFIEQLLDGLSALHDAGVVHRDLKPDNIIYTMNKPRTLKLLDFGIARSLQVDATVLTQTGVMIGTPAYMAPEQLLGEAATYASDVYAVGLIWYEMLSKSLPFGANTIKAVMKRLRKTVEEPIIPATLPGAPLELKRFLVGRLLPGDADDRPANARELMKEFRELKEKLDTTKPTPAAPAPRKSPATPPAAMIFRGSVKRGSKPGVQTTPPPKPRPSIEERLMKASARMPRDIEEGKSPSPRQAPKPRRPATPAPAPPPSTPVTATLEDSPPPTSESSAPRPRAVVVVKLPASRLLRREERSWLGEQVSGWGRGFTFGAQFWIAVLVARDVESAREKVDTLATDLTGRFGEIARFSSKEVSEDFNLTIAALSGTAPMPTEITELITELARS